jgi:predicted ArsR family transcriptional regulator
MQATRKDILDFLRGRRRATVREIGEHLSLTATGIRQHLTVLERDGLVTASEERGHVGRPALVYRLTDAGDALYPKKYDELANAFIEEAHALLGPQALQQLMRRVASRFASAYMPRLESLPLDERVAELREILVERGNIASCRQEGDEHFVEKQTCPFWNVAVKNSAVCALDVQFIRELAGTDARLTTSLLRGDGCCTFRLRPVQDASAR